MFISCVYLVKSNSHVSMFSSQTCLLFSLKVKHLLFLYTNVMPLSICPCQHGKVYLSKSDKNRKDNRLLNESLTDSMDETEDILDIDSWFDDEIQSSMIFIFISCIIALIAFVFLCFKHEKLRMIMSIYMASPNNAAALSDNPTRHRSDIFLCTSYQPFV